MIEIVKEAYNYASIVAPENKYLHKLKQFIDNEILIDELAVYESMLETETTRFSYSKDWDSIESHKMHCVYWAFNCAIMRDGNNVIPASERLASFSLEMCIKKAYKCDVKI